jgi:4-azaleucine resistance transporter AzlC
MRSSADRSITSNALGIGIASGAYALSFGAIAVASGLSVWQAQVLSLGMFTGASQFAMIGVLGAGGTAVAAVATAALLGARNGLYALTLTSTLGLRGWRRIVGSHFMIDETTAMALAAAPDTSASRRAFWTTGLSIFVLWNLGTIVGALGASLIGDPKALGLDAAIPAAFLALLWPRLRSRDSIAIALAGALVAIVLTPLTSPGIPVLCAAAVAVIFGLATWRRGAAVTPLGTP